MKHYLKKILRRLLGNALTEHVAAGGSPEALQIYSGYENQDIAVLKTFATHEAGKDQSSYTDGFGVKTLYECVPFVTAETLNLERLQLPVPDDGFHAEAIEYIAVTDALQRFQKQSSFCAVEIGAGWGPWITLAGVIARQRGVEQIKLVGVEASDRRFSLMSRHLQTNGLRPAECVSEDMLYDSVFTRLFNGAIWTHDGEIWFPEADVVDMGAAASESDQPADYRGAKLNNKAIACKKLDTLLHDMGCIDFMHIDIQGSELELIHDQIDWLSTNVKTLMIASHSRPIEGRLIELLFSKDWQLHREKPCRVDWYKNVSMVGKTMVDGSQYWLNRKFINAAPD